LFSIYTNSKSFTIPSLLPQNDDEVIYKNDIINFSTVNTTTLNEGETDIDTNKFQLSSNIFTENFIPNYYGLLNFYNIRKLSMTNDTYTLNTGIYKEAMISYGSISVNSGSTNGFDGYNFEEFFFADSGVSSVQNNSKQIIIIVINNLLFS
jgi:hypothetical protein